MMQPQENSQNHSPSPDKKGFPPEHLVAFYTLLTILMKMKKELGLEAMLEYMAKYLAVIDSHNPQLSMAVAKTLEHIPTGVIYGELGKYPKKEI